jgi:hypothetical protein
MKKINLSEVAIKPEAWVFFQTDPILSKIEREEEKIGAFIVAVVGQWPAKTVDAMRKASSAINKLEEGKGECEFSDDEFRIVKEAWDTVSPNFAVRTGNVILPICDYFDGLAK